jgi:mRNA-degrading endonuclease toxin of MazEF toxin-antitoxin module
VSSPCFGRIVWVEVPDPQGRDPKRRPAVIITPTEEIQPDGQVTIVAISTSFTEAPAEVQVELPWDAKGTSKTQLRRRSWAVCSWLATVSLSSVIEYRGIVPPRQMIEIRAKLDEMLPPGKASSNAS